MLLTPRKRWSTDEMIDRKMVKTCRRWGTTRRIPETRVANNSARLGVDIRERAAELGIHLILGGWFVVGVAVSLENEVGALD